MSVERDFLMRSVDIGRIVPSANLTNKQIIEARLNGRFHVDNESGIGFAILPWPLTTKEDLLRAAEFAVNDSAYLATLCE